MPEVCDTVYALIQLIVKSSEFS